LLLLLLAVVLADGKWKDGKKWRNDAINK